MYLGQFNYQGKKSHSSKILKVVQWPGSREKLWIWSIPKKKSKKWIALIIFACFRFSWRHQLREFKSEFRVVAIDMRGYGESDLPLSTENYRFDYLVTDVKDIVEYLGERKGLCVSVVLQKSTQHFDSFLCQK